jgi:hypothetical protein
LDTSESRSEIPGNFRNVVLGKDGEISWTVVREISKYYQRVKEERNILHTIKRRKANWIGHMLRRNCLLKHVIEGKIEERIDETGRRGRRRKQLLDGLNKKTGYCKLNQEEIDRTLWRTRFGSGYGHVRQSTGGIKGLLKRPMCIGPLRARTHWVFV